MDLVGGKVIELLELIRRQMRSILALEEELQSAMARIKALEASKDEPTTTNA